MHARGLLNSKPTPNYTIPKPGPCVKLIEELSIQLGSNVYTGKSDQVGEHLRVVTPRDSLVFHATLSLNSKEQEIEVFYEMLANKLENSIQRLTSICRQADRYNVDCLQDFIAAC